VAGLEQNRAFTTRSAQNSILRVARVTAMDAATSMATIHVTRYVEVVSTLLI
jgi:hypothetical protein